MECSKLMTKQQWALVWVVCCSVTLTWPIHSNHILEKLLDYWPSKIWYMMRGLACATYNWSNSAPEDWSSISQTWLLWEVRGLCGLGRGIAGKDSLWMVGSGRTNMCHHGVPSYLMRYIRCNKACNDPSQSGCCMWTGQCSDLQARSLDGPWPLALHIQQLVLVVWSSSNLFLVRGGHLPTGLNTSMVSTANSLGFALFLFGR